jgi:hypothetical protein
MRNREANPNTDLITEAGVMRRLAALQVGYSSCDIRAIATGQAEHSVLSEDTLRSNGGNRSHT